MKAVIYKVNTLQKVEWLVLIHPDKPEETGVASCAELHYAEALCKGMEWEYSIEGD